jgi:hypothetical protein
MRTYLSPKDVLNILKVARGSSTRDWCMFLLTFRHALRSREARQLIGNLASGLPVTHSV